MPPPNQAPMGFERMDIDDQIIEELREGRNVPSNLAEQLDVSRQYVQQRLKLLEAADHVENVGRGVYELIYDPRDLPREPVSQRRHETYEQDNWETAHVDRIDYIGAFEAPPREENEPVRVDLDGHGHGGASLHEVDENIQVSFWLTEERTVELYEQLEKRLVEIRSDGDRDEHN